MMIFVIHKYDDEFLVSQFRETGEEFDEFISRVELESNHSIEFIVSGEQLVLKPKEYAIKYDLVRYINDDSVVLPRELEIQDRPVEEVINDKVKELDELRTKQAEVRQELDNLSRG